MRYDELVNRISTPVFQTHQVAQLFPEESNVALRFQLSRLVKRHKVIRLKRGLYLFKERPIDELVLANFIYEPSYVSMEKALNLYGIMPDIPGNVTSITTTTPNNFVTPLGTYSYSAIQKHLYFGFTQKLDAKSRLSYRIAEPEKAILDWLYVRKITALEVNRFDLSSLDHSRVLEFGRQFPAWVVKAIYE